MLEAEAIELQLGREEEARRKIAEVTADKQFMAGAHEALASWQQGEKPIPSSELKRKYAR
jgi:hypothetical protein